MESESLMQTPEEERPSMIALLSFDEPRYPTFLSVSSLLTDVLLVHDLAVLLSYPEYRAYQFGPDFWLRQERPIAPFHQARVHSIVKQSPLDVGLVIAAIGAIWAFVQILDKVANWQLNRQKLELDLIKAKQDIVKNNQEIALKELETMQKSASLEKVIHERNAEQIFVTLTTRLSQSDIKLRDLGLRSIRL
jgi:hypothetical protein